MRRRRRASSHRRWSVATTRRRLGLKARTWRNLLLVAAVVAAMIAFERFGWGIDGRDDLARYDGRTLLVVRVIDGDTLDVAWPDGDRDFTRVRLWGIDAPELARPWEPDHPGEPGAAAARDALRTWAEHRLVALELVPSRIRDNFDRVLAYVYDMQGVCLNEKLVAEGLAPADGRWWHPQRAAYEVLDQSARRAKRGVWTRKKPLRNAGRQEPE